MSLRSLRQSLISICVVLFKILGDEIFVFVDYLERLIALDRCDCHPGDEYGVGNDVVFIISFTKHQFRLKPFPLPVSILKRNSIIWKMMCAMLNSTIWIMLS